MSHKSVKKMRPEVRVEGTYVHAVCDYRCPQQIDGYCRAQRCVNASGREVLQAVHHGHSGCTPWYRRYVRVLRTPDCDATPRGGAAVLHVLTGAVLVEPAGGRNE